VVRPYPRAVAGELIKFSFDIKRRVFELQFRHDPAIDKPTEVFIPDYQYPRGYEVKLSDGSSVQDAVNQLLIYTHSCDRTVHTIRVTARR
jgi:hypothetical protein